MRYFWIKLRRDFFASKRIKKMRRLPGGDTLLIIYLKMQLLSLTQDGYLYFSGLESDFAEELALDLDESPENVKLTISYLQSVGLLETTDNQAFYLPFVAENTGSETASAQRVRDFRSRKALQCNTDVTQVKRTCSVEKEIDIEKDIEKEKEGYGGKTDGIGQNAVFNRVSTDFSTDFEKVREEALRKLETRIR